MTTTVDYLIPYVRLRIGDTDPDAYRYLDTWIRTALILSLKELAGYWRNKYYISDDGIVTRNINVLFTLSEDYGLIEDDDESVIILAASIIILEGSLENSAWDAISWRDAEISFSNLEKLRSKNEVLDKLIAKFNNMVVSPGKKLARARKGHLPGYIGNELERTTKY